MTDSNNTPNSADIATPLAGLVGEGKKFKTVDDLAIGKLESDNFIKQLQGENKELRDLVKGLADQVTVNNNSLEFLTKVVKGENGEPGNQPVVPKQGDGKVTNPGLTAEDVARLIEQNRVNDQLNRNKHEVRNTLLGQLGAESDAYIEAKSKELGISKEELFDLAGRAPQAFYGLVGITPNGVSRNAGLSSYVAGSGTLAPNGGKPAVRNKAYYDNLKKEMGTVKFIMNKDIQIQLHKDAQSLGDSWES